ncbi:hypothetical protein J3R82DRAFT_10968 [Butyriboletus roseoflavus]|nr:hypothetical protein J3R82DRAFT_10968 [Butyriboletus roseoflavus]
MLGSAQGCHALRQFQTITSLSGYHLAEASLFISVAMSLAVLKISKDVVDGVEVTPNVDVTSGVIRWVPFSLQYPQSLLHEG